MTPGPDDHYYADWALDFDDDWKPSPPRQIDLAAVAIFLWIIIGSLI